jgi:hypothetical protein
VLGVVAVAANAGGLADLCLVIMSDNVYYVLINQPKALQ